MDNKILYFYDDATGELKDSVPSWRKAGVKYGTSKTWISHNINKYKFGRLPSKGLVYADVKYDICPLEELKSLPVMNTPKIQHINTSPTILSDKIKNPEMTISEEQLRQKHDMFFIVISYIKKIPEGMFVEESQMLRELSLQGKPRYRDTLGRVELKEHRGKVDGTVYYGSTDSIKKLKQEGILQ